MVSDIARARGNNESPVKAPLYDAPAGTTFANVASYDVVNTVAKNDGTSILSLLGEVGYTDIQGATVRMVAKVGEREFSDVVTIIGEKQASYIVRIGEDDYAVRKSIARFCKN